jgi:hypothetical protein
MNDTPKHITDRRAGEFVTIRRELFEELIDYAYAMRGVWGWKEGSIPQHQADFVRLKATLAEAFQLRDATGAEEEERT